MKSEDEAVGGVAGGVAGDQEVEGAGSEAGVEAVIF